MAGLAGAALADSIPPPSPKPTASLSDQSGQPSASPAAVPAAASSVPNPAPFALPQLAAPQFRADASAPSRPASAGPWGVLSGDWQNQNLLGDMGGVRPALAKYGVTLTILENFEVFGNLSGGVQQSLVPKGLTTVTLQMDTEKAFGLKGGTLNVSGLQIYGGRLNDDDLLVLQTLSDIEAPVGIRLWELWYQQKFGDKFDVKVGEQSLDEEFIIAPSGNSLFINGVSGWPGLPTVDLPAGGPAYPLASLGARARAQVTDSVTLLAGVFNGSPIPFDSPNMARSNPHGVSFPLDTGTLAIAELQYAYGSSASGKPSSDGPLPGVYKIGAWYDSYKFDDQQYDTIGLPLASPLSNGDPAEHHGDFSLYGVMDQMIWRSKDNTNRSLNVFFRPMF
ncbi:MAG TPA: carbohydrate porin, partial [Acidobacteriaceae bacterium]